MSPYCRHCGRPFPSERGLTIHISRTVTCRKALRKVVNTLLAKRKREVVSEVESVRSEVEDETTIASGDEDVTTPYPSPPPPPDLPLPEPARKKQRTTTQATEANAQGTLPHTRSAPSYYVKEFKGAGKTYGKAPTEFERFMVEQEKHELPPWAPYHSQEEWELVQWLTKHRVTQCAIEAYLRLKIVSYFLK